ncbi:NADH-quinone oxidoreductase subunit C [Curtanaerobium respiraculi]|uniref:NADH-quinone oxidoreductase subunit C n=1 Tax=Curtanaerobium respiraculi TaxID=2949669 RepID=UPI0024B3BDC0|nr:NADH-quinone oxidoreductase subunit C [Curtanaerobium respiraculi]
MGLTRKFTDIELPALRDLAQEKYDTGWRAVQTHCVNADSGIDLVYTFEKDGVYDNYRIRGVQKGTPVSSLQDLDLALFPFENEAHDLFGVNMTGMVLDFQGGFYDLAEKEPMTVITPELKERREKAAKAAKLKAERAAAAAAKKAAQEGKGE